MDVFCSLSHAFLSQIHLFFFFFSLSLSLSLSPSLSQIVSKLQPIIQTFRYANKLLPTRIMKQFYYSHIYPHLLGAITIWGSADSKKTYMQPLIRSHKKIIRLVKNLPPRSHTRPIMTELGILNLSNLYTFRVCLDMHPFVYPSIHINRPEHCHKYTLASQIHKHATRFSTQQHHHIQHTTDHLTQSYSRIWNTIPNELRATASLTLFKAGLKRHLLHAQAQCKYE